MGIQKGFSMKPSIFDEVTKALATATSRRQALRRVSAWRKVKDVYGWVSEEKLRWLQYSHHWLIASFLLALIAVVVPGFSPDDTDCAHTDHHRNPFWIPTPFQGVEGKKGICRCTSAFGIVCQK